jgi:hypothetical protein
MLIHNIGDYKIRLNDHPYALTPEITHLVVWSALRFPQGITKAERMQRYEKFVEQHFGEISTEKRRWFLNWGSIQSVPGLEVYYLASHDLIEAFPCFVEGCGS